MRILLIHQMFATAKEPGSTRHFELARYLVRQGHQVTVIGGTVNVLTGQVAERARRRLLSEEWADGVRVWRAYTFPGHNRSFLQRLLGFLSFMVTSLVGGLRAGEIDVVIAASPQIFTGISGWLIGRVRRVPFVFEVRDLWPDFVVAMGVLRQPLLIALAKGLERFIYRRADYFIINSPGFRAHLEGFGVPGERIFLIPNGADVEAFCPSPRDNQVRKELGLDGRFVVMYAGAHGAANDLETVVEAARLLRDEQGVRFLLVGDGKEKGNLRQLCERYRLDNVQFVGAQPKEVMPDFCTAADVCLAILKDIAAFRTVYPNKLFDYMAAGRPILIAIDGVARQVVEDAQAGVFVPPGDPQVLAEAVLALRDDPALLERYGANARRYVEAHFDRRKIAQELETVLERILRCEFEVTDCRLPLQRVAPVHSMETKPHCERER